MTGQIELRGYLSVENMIGDVIQISMGLHIGQNYMVLWYLYLITDPLFMDKGQVQWYKI